MENSDLDFFEENLTILLEVTKSINWVNVKLDFESVLNSFGSTISDQMFQIFGNR